MNISIKLIKKKFENKKIIEEYNYFELNDLDPKRYWIDLVHELDEEYVEYYYSYLVLDDNNNKFNYLKYDDFYGPVEFHAMLDTFTIEQLTARFGTSLVIEREDTGKGAVGDYIPSLINFLIIIADFYLTHYDVREHHKTKLTNNVNQENKILRYLESENVSALLMMEYLYNKDKLTVPLLQVAFPGFTSEEIHEIMPLFFFEYDLTSKRFTKTRGEQIAPEYMLQLNALQQFKIMHLFIGYRARGTKLLDINMDFVYNKFHEEIEKDLLFEILKELYKNFNYTLNDSNL